MLNHKIILFGLLLFSPLVYSATYSWVDENGVTHYSQTKPPSGNYKILNPKQSYPSDQAQVKPEPQTPARPTTESPPQAPASAVAQKADEAQCQNVTSDLETLKLKPRVKIETADGIKVLTVEEKQAMIDERMDWLERFCK